MHFFLGAQTRNSFGSLLSILLRDWRLGLSFDDLLIWGQQIWWFEIWWFAPVLSTGAARRVYGSDRRTPPPPPPRADSIHSSCFLHNQCSSSGHRLGIQFAHTVPWTELTLLCCSIIGNISPSNRWAGRRAYLSCSLLFPQYHCPLWIVSPYIFDVRNKHWALNSLLAVVDELSCGGFLVPSPGRIWSSCWGLFIGHNLSVSTWSSLSVPVQEPSPPHHCPQSPAPMKHLLNFPENGELVDGAGPSSDVLAL